MKIFLIECAVFIVLFTATVVTIAKTHDPVSYIFDYPQPIVDRVYEMGLIPSAENVVSTSVKVKKMTVALLIGVIMGFVVSKVNHAETFLQGFLIVYGLWLVVDWYDVLLDIVWFCHDKSLVIPGTEDLVDSYHDYMYHVKASAKGVLLGIPAAIISGIVCALL